MDDFSIGANFALAPALGILVFTGSTAYLRAGRFFSTYSDLSSRVALFAACLSAVLLPTAFDSELQPRSWIPESATSARSFLILSVGFGVTLIARLVDLESRQPRRILAAIVGGATLLMTLRSIWKLWGFEEMLRPLRTAAINFASDHPVTTLLAILIAIGLPQWYRLGKSVRLSRFQGLRELFQRDRRGVALGAVAFLLALITLLYELPLTLVPDLGLTPEQRADAVTQERRTLLAILGAFGAGLTLVYTHLRHLLERDANATGRYTEAVQQLGSDSMSIPTRRHLCARACSPRLAQRRADRNRGTCFLCSRRGTTDVRCWRRLDIVAALTALESTAQATADGSHLGSIDLSGSRLEEGRLHSVQFPSA
ncbi:hypothetical protein [Aeromicrobium sp. UC242_57]|uniref:hypothetical protein n=1 Tax=Aeromicrobium sp. UC242_57 TaxID=3374624 RepID=UPI0037B5FACF